MALRTVSSRPRHRAKRQTWLSEPARAVNASRARKRLPTLGELSVDRNNNLNLLRMIAASAVIISHSFPITAGKDAIQPMEELTGVQLGTMGLYVFFAISGFLIADSYHRSRTMSHFVTARFLRIFPGLLVVLLVTVLALGPLTSTLPLGEYFRNPGTITYVPSNLSLYFLQYELPGVFEGNPQPGTINGSLWTLFYEVVCYAGVVVAGALAIFARRRRLWLAVFAYALVWVAVFVVQDAAPQPLIALRDLSLPFFIGMVLYSLRDKVRLSYVGLVLLGVLPFLLGPSTLGRLSVVAAISYGVFVLGYRIKGPLLRYNRLGDYSYGTYIYGFPVQQSLVFVIPAMTAVWNAVLALALALVLAIASWHFVEKPALARKKTYGNALVAAVDRLRAPQGSRRPSQMDEAA